MARPGIYGIALNGKNNTQQIADTDGGQYDDDTRFDRAVGPMQFIPSTWSVVGVDGDSDGTRNPQDIDDAALATAVYLCSGDDDLSGEKGQRASVYRYNHSNDYVDLVLSIMQAYMDGDFSAVPNSTPTYRRDHAFHLPHRRRGKGDKGGDKGSKGTKGGQEESTPTKNPTPTSTPTPTTTPTPTPTTTPTATPTSSPTKNPTVVPTTPTTLPTLPDPDDVADPPDPDDPAAAPDAAPGSARSASPRDWSTTCSTPTIPSTSASRTCSTPESDLTSAAQRAAPVVEEGAPAPPVVEEGALAPSRRHGRPPAQAPGFVTVAARPPQPETAGSRPGRCS